MMLILCLVLWMGVHMGETQPVLWSNSSLLFALLDS